MWLLRKPEFSVNPDCAAALAALTSAQERADSRCPNGAWAKTFVWITAAGGVHDAHSDAPQGREHELRYAEYLEGSALVTFSHAEGDPSMRTSVLVVAGTGYSLTPAAAGQDAVGTWYAQHGVQVLSDAVVFMVDLPKGGTVIGSAPNQLSVSVAATASAAAAAAAPPSSARLARHRAFKEAIKLCPTGLNWGVEIMKAMRLAVQLGYGSTYEKAWVAAQEAHLAEGRKVIAGAWAAVGADAADDQQEKVVAAMTSGAAEGRKVIAAAWAAVGADAADDTQEKAMAAMMSGLAKRNAKRVALRVDELPDGFTEIKPLLKETGDFWHSGSFYWRGSRMKPRREGTASFTFHPDRGVEGRAEELAKAPAYAAADYPWPRPKAAKPEKAAKPAVTKKAAPKAKAKAKEAAKPEKTAKPAATKKAAHKAKAKAKH